MPLTFTEPDALARVYARSLFELAEQQGGQEQIEAIGAELEEIVELARSERQFSEFLSSRILGSEVRASSLEKMFRGRVSELTLKFLLVLNQKDRLGHLAPIAAAFDGIMQDKFGRVEVDVYTAQTIDPRELEAVRARLRAALGKDPVVHTYVEPAMIGGVKLQIGDRLIDGSVASELRKLRDRLTTERAAEVRAKASKFFES